MSQPSWRQPPEQDPREVGVDPTRLDEIAADFAETLEAGTLYHGAQLAIYRRGVRVLDLGGGLARVRTQRPVTPESLFLLFRATKGLTALAMLILYERGAFHYDEPVVKYWPEFARAIPEKRGVTIRHVMSHRGGFPLGPKGFRPEGWCDPEQVAAAMEEVRLRFEPGTRNAYHPMNFGHLLATLVPRIDGRDLGRFLMEEAFAPLGLRDLYLGLPEDDALEERVAWIYGPLGLGGEQVVERRADGSTRLVPKPPPPPPPEYADQPELATAWNRPTLHRAVIPAAGAIGTARDLARVYAVLAQGGHSGDLQLVSREGLRAVTAPTNRRDDKDGTLGFPMRWGTGFHLGGFGKGSSLDTFGHAGVGGQMAFADPERELAFAFLCNGERDESCAEWRLRLQSLAFEACIER